ncbi:hypothetical protein DFH11DRAFT_830218 [Phellopilus nigrolimitatus]|nr:hypothetical protein DFH11DRAFT_830218 [Phellopilus nigrolimitatus]
MFDVDESESDGDGGSVATEDDCDVESAYDNDDDNEGSDEDVNEALVAPTKTLFSEHDDLHLYGLTSVFRLRHRTPLRTLRTHSHREDYRTGTVNIGKESGHNSYPSSQDRNTGRSRLPLQKNHLTPHVEGFHSDSSALPPHMQAHPSYLRKSAKKNRRSEGKARARTIRSVSPARTQRHVLMIGDQAREIWKGCECQSECWNRWLPKNVPLSRSEHDVLLDRLFLFFSSWGMRIIPEYFLRDMHTFLHPSSSSRPTSPASPMLPKLAHYSPFLHNTLLSVATAFSTDREIRKREIRSRFAEEAKAYIEEECSRPNISTVQALGMLASYYSGMGQQTLGFMYFGMSARIAQALGLCADCTPLLRAGRLKPQQVFDRAWAFHMGCAQDACWSLYVGRECGISLPLSSSIHNQNQNVEVAGSVDAGSEGPKLKTKSMGESTTLAMDDPFCLKTISAGGVYDRLDTMAWRGRGGQDEIVGSGVSQCKTFTNFLWSSQLMKISRRIMDLMNRLTTSDGGLEIKLLVTDIDIQLDAWRQDLPAELKLTPSNESSALPHKLMTHAAFWWLLILLHRPFYRRRRAKSVDSSLSIARCNNAAREILGILRLWRRIYGTVRYAPITLVQTIFASGTIYILQAMQASLGRRPATQSQASALDNVQELVDLLRECAESWECAIRIADIFEKLLVEQKSAMEGGGSMRKTSRKKRRMSAMKAGVGADATGKTASHLSMSVIAEMQAEESESGEISSPVIQAQASPYVVHPPAQPHYLFQYGQTHLRDSQIIGSPITDNEQPPSQHVLPNSIHNNFRASYPNTGNFAHHIGYFSDESYASDSQYVSTEDLDHPMSNSEGQADLGSTSALDFNFLYNSETSMDAAMPGMGMFVPTGLSGMALGMDPVVAGAPAFGTMDLASHASGSSSRGVAAGFGVASGGSFNPYADTDFTSEGEDGAVHGVIAALNNSQHYHF